MKALKLFGAVGVLQRPRCAGTAVGDLAQLLTNSDD